MKEREEAKKDQSFMKCYDVRTFEAKVDFLNAAAAALESIRLKV